MIGAMLILSTWATLPWSVSTWPGPFMELELAGLRARIVQYRQAIEPFELSFEFRGSRGLEVFQRGKASVYKSPRGEVLEYTEFNGEPRLDRHVLTAEEYICVEHPPGEQVSVVTRKPRPSRAFYLNRSPMDYWYRIEALDVLDWLTREGVVSLERLGEGGTRVLVESARGDDGVSNLLLRFDFLENPWTVLSACHVFLPAEREPSDRVPSPKRETLVRGGRAWVEMTRRNSEFALIDGFPIPVNLRYEMFHDDSCAEILVDRGSIRLNSEEKGEKFEYPSGSYVFHDRFARQSETRLAPQGDSESPADIVEEVSSSEHHHAGEIAATAPVSHVFQWTNLSEKSVEIVGVKKTCTCTDVLFSSEIVAPRETIEIVVTVDQARRLRESPAEVRFETVPETGVHVRRLSASITGNVVEALPDPNLLVLRPGVAGAFEGHVIVRVFCDRLADVSGVELEVDRSVGNVNEGVSIVALEPRRGLRFPCREFEVRLVRVLPLPKQLRLRYRASGIEESFSIPIRRQKE